MKVKKIEEKNGIYHLTTNNDTYLIEKPNVVCTCCLRCDKCNICLHTFTCSCIQYSIKWVICIHIHYLVEKLGNLNFYFDLFKI